MDGEVVELPGGVESSLKDEGVEVRVEPKRVPEGLIRDDGGGGDGFANGRAVELHDEVEDQPCKRGEKALVMAKEDPQGLGQSEDELAVGEGKEQLLIEVLGEQECPLLAARWAQKEALAGEGTEVLVAALGIRTSDASHPLAVVVA